jgi:hypothetical protein
LLDASLKLVRDLLAADEDEKRAALAQRFEACRAALADGATPQDLADLRLYRGRPAGRGRPPGRLAEILAQREERARDMAAIVAMSVRWSPRSAAR